MKGVFVVSYETPNDNHDVDGVFKTIEGARKYVCEEYDEKAVDLWSSVLMVDNVRELWSLSETHFDDGFYYKITLLEVSE